MCILSKKRGQYLGPILLSTSNILDSFFSSGNVMKSPFLFFVDYCYVVDLGSLENDKD